MKNRWLSEGTAEFSARQAAKVMGLPDEKRGRTTDEVPFFPLDQWGSPVNFTTASSQILSREYEGYDRATRLLQIAQERAGGPALKGAYAALVPLPKNTVTSAQFMDALEDRSGVNLDGLFSGWVFPADFGGRLAERRQAPDRFSALQAQVAAQAPDLSHDALDAIRANINAWKFAEANSALEIAGPGLDAYLKVRDRLTALKAGAQAAGLAYPLPYQQAETSLGFVPLLASIDRAEAALSAYTAAQSNVSTRRSFWQKIGLLGKAPGSQLTDAAGDFAWARFDDAISHSRAAQATADDVTANAPRNLAIGGALMVVLLVAGWAGVRWALRREPAGAGSES